MHFVRLLFVGVALTNILLVLFAAVTLREARIQYEERAAIITRNLANLAEKELAGIIKSADLAILAVSDEYARQRRSGSVDESTMAAFVARAHSRHGFLESLRMTDAKGSVIYGDDDGDSRKLPVSVMDRDYFIRVRENPKGELFISKPVVSRISGKAVMTLSRRIDRPDNGFDGIIYAAISVATLTRTLSEIAVGAHGSIALRDADLGIIARYPQAGESSEILGNNVISRELRELVLSGEQAGTIHAVAPFDSIERVASYRRVSGFPLHIVVGISIDDYLAVWRKSAVRAWVGIGLFLLLSLALSALVYRYWKRQTLTAMDLERQARTDALTNLINRRYFLELAESELARSQRYGNPLSMLMLDIDFFKQVNDTYGHKTGDMVLQNLAEICRNSMREVDIIGRLGGEEFAVLLPQTDRNRALEAADRLRLSIADAVLTSASGSPLKLTVSIGVTTLTGENSSVDLLLSQADQALYRAKEAGRNSVAVAAPLSLPGRPVTSGRAN
jgi:diguanylate cyclase (GGDEF)-like protein